jgi:hypothetical protein
MHAQAYKAFEKKTWMIRMLAGSVRELYLVKINKHLD